MFSTFFRRWVLLVSFRCYLGFIRVCLSNGLMILLGTRTDFSANAFYATINLHFSQLSRWLDFWLVSLNRLKLYKKTRKRKSWQHLLQLGSFTMRCCSENFHFCISWLACSSWPLYQWNDVSPFLTQGTNLCSWKKSSFASSPAVNLTGAMKYCIH